jgi:hypothetical protein
MNEFVGRWKSVDPWQTEVLFEITEIDGACHVRAVDGSDDEEAEIYELRLSRESLMFAAHWSSGQFTKYRLRRLGEHVEAVFTYTGTTHFERDTRKD